MLGVIGLTDLLYAADHVPHTSGKTTVYRYTQANLPYLYTAEYLADMYLIDYYVRYSLVYDTK